ncbi:hypothetical protein CKAH01_13235 [Colletotrichum kahawae]|uniref:Uncharacterized protein n=1 Tax=Colletotrichum kahawae TaxID=34407 RepID=A0AAE0DE25_COLKA|nr:hypothetical protein CKAH01_13235 [Colletotrichum kahawae]
MESFTGAFSQRRVVVLSHCWRIMHGIRMLCNKVSWCSEQHLNLRLSLLEWANRQCGVVNSNVALGFWMPAELECHSSDGFHFHGGEGSNGWTEPDFSTSWHRAWKKCTVYRE